jgi:hypothetical protein
VRAMDSSVLPVMTWYYSIVRNGFRPTLTESIDPTPLLLGAVEFVVALLAAVVLRGLWIRISALTALRLGAKHAAPRTGRRLDVAQFPRPETEASVGKRPAA